MAKKTKVGFVSLGCSKNLVDTEVMIGLVKEKGYSIVNDADKADIIVINTCCFIKQAREESHGTILEFSRLRKNGRLKKLVVAGCMPQRYKENIVDMYPEVDIFLGCNDFSSITGHLDTTKADKPEVITGSKDFIYSSSMPRVNTGMASAYVKVSEGCSEQCTFCIVPKIRGRFRSRSIEDILKEAQELSQKGVKEINLIAQNLTAYGKDIYGGPRLLELLERLCTVDGIKWIRLLYNYPSDFSDDMINIIAKEDKICKYVDMPLQHIDDQILQRMGRKTDSSMIRRLLDKLKNIKGLVIRSSFIAGFPGETQAQFEKLLEFVREYQFDKIAVFPYSKEENTLAGKYGEDVPEKTVLERYDRLTDIKKEVAVKKNQNFLNMVTDILVEACYKTKGGYDVKGRFYGQAPEVDGFVYFNSKEKISAGQFKKVKLLKCDSYDFYGELN